MRNEIRSRAVGALAIPLALACGGGGGSGGPTDPVLPTLPSLAIQTSSATPARFIPSSAALAAGGTVSWTNVSAFVHDLIATTDNWHLSRTLPPGQSFETTIPQPGTYRYRCTIHEGMNGSIEVR